SFMSDRLIKTPNIDYIAQNGIIFSNAYVTGAVCSPSRAGMLTGVNQATFGYVFNYVQSRSYNIPDTAYGVPPNRPLVGDYLRSEGYRTGMVGKWHLGLSDACHPLNRG